VANVSELEEGTYWVAEAAGTAVALVVEGYWHDATFATWGPAGVVMYGAVDSERMRDLSLSRLSLRLGGRPSWRGEDAPDATEVERLWKAERRYRAKLQQRAAAELERLADGQPTYWTGDQHVTPTLPVMGDFSRYFALDAPGRATFTPKQPGETADAFYRRVAAFYLLAAEHSGKPLQAICEGAGVPKTTAARWAREARGRGFLPETTRGKA